MKDVNGVARFPVQVVDLCPTVHTVAEQLHQQADSLYQPWSERAAPLGMWEVILKVQVTSLERARRSLGHVGSHLESSSVKSEDDSDQTPSQWPASPPAADFAPLLLPLEQTSHSAPLVSWGTTAACHSSNSSPLYLHVLQQSGPSPWPGFPARYSNASHLKASGGLCRPVWRCLPRRGRNRPLLQVAPEIQARRAIHAIPDAHPAPNSMRPAI